MLFVVDNGEGVDGHAAVTLEEVVRVGRIVHAQHT
jgi:hypothetical protein